MENMKRDATDIFQWIEEGETASMVGSSVADTDLRILSLNTAADGWGSVIENLVDGLRELNPELLGWGARRPNFSDVAYRLCGIWLDPRASAEWNKF